MKPTACLLAACVMSIVLADTCLAQTAAPTTAPTTRPALKFTISKETTRITEPLRADGRPDYLAAINAAHSKGVTKDNNALVPYVQAVGMDVLYYNNKTMQAQFLKALDMEAPKGPFLKTSFAEEGFDDLAEITACLAGPAKAADHPKAAAWIKANEAPLKLIVEASKRTRWFYPLMGTGNEPAMISALMPSLASYRAACKMLVIRANFAAADGRVDDAMQDLLAAARLGRLMDQGYSLIERLVGIACSKIADDGIANLATGGLLDAKAARKLMAQLSPIGTCTVISSIDEGERYVILDTLCYFSTNSPQQNAKDLARLTSLLEPIQNPDGSLTQPDTGSGEHFLPAAERSKNANWDAPLKKANRLFDQKIARMQMSDLKIKRALASGAVNEEFKDYSRATFERVEALTTQPADPTNRDTIMGDVVIAMLMPSLEKAQFLADRAAITRDLSMVALALAAYKADKGQYPEKLAALAPAYVKAVPKDFFSGKDFVYRIEGKGGGMVYILYSVGYDLNDDGGDKTKDIVVKAEK